MYTILYAKNGQPEWAVIPYEQYQHFLDAIEMLEDIQAFDEAKEAIAQGEELVPSAIVDALLEGENPIAVWRVYRGVSQQELAHQVGLSLDSLAELEGGQLRGDELILSRIARALNLEIEDLM